MNGRGNVWAVSSLKNTFRYFPELKIVLPILVTISIIALVITETFKKSDVEPHNESRPIAIEVGDFREITDPAEKYKGKKLLALTFDDGPSEYTERLLDILNNKNVKATFFVLGSRASAFPNLISREIADGHEVESHTFAHKDLTTISRGEIENEISSAEQTICNAENKQGCIKYVRPPYGAVNGVVRSIAKVPLIGWSVDSDDWRSRDAGQVKEKVLGTAFDGAIVLMHDIYDSTITGVEWMLDDLREQGYTFVTIDELVKTRNPNLETGVLYGKFES